MLGHTSRVLAFLLLATFFLAGAHADCYWPDGTENDQHQPCYSPHGGAIGLCCGAGDVCLSNGVCMSQSATRDTQNDKIYYRGSCTFRDWSEGSNCPTVCIKGSGISPHTDVGVIPCPDSDTKWYCADGNMSKANCSSGAFIVSLQKPVSFTTVGVSPTRATHTPTSTSTSSTSSTSNGESSATSTSDSGNSTAPAAAPTSFSSGVSGAPQATSTDASGTDPSASPAPSTPPSSSSSANVPLAVGVTIGGASIIAACVIVYFLWRRKKRDGLAVAESPPPRDVPDDDIMNAVLAGPLFRSASLLSRRPSKTNLNMSGGDAPPPMPDTASVLSSNRADSLRSGSMLSTFQHQQHHQHGYPQDRFSSDIVAMHSMRRTPPAGWHYHNGHPSTSEPIPEIPYDGRRLAPYHGVPILEHDGFSELPG